MSASVHRPESRTGSEHEGIRAAVGGLSPSQPNASLGSSRSPLVRSNLGPGRVRDDVDSRPAGGRRDDTSHEQHPQREGTDLGAKKANVDVEMVAVEAMMPVRPDREREAPQNAEIGSMDAAMQASYQPPPLRCTTGHPSHTPVDRPPRSPKRATLDPAAASIGQKVVRSLSHRAHEHVSDGNGYAHLGGGASSASSSSAVSSSPSTPAALATVAAMTTAQARAPSVHSERREKQLPTPVVARRRRAGTAVSSQNGNHGATAERQGTDAAVTGVGGAGDGGCGHTSQAVSAGDGSQHEVRSAGEMWGTFLDTPPAAVPSSPDRPTPRPASASDVVAVRTDTRHADVMATVGAAGPAAATTAPASDHTLDPPVITASDYSDRQRLLYHITFLSTQLQRAQLALQEQQRTLTILHGAVHAHGPHARHDEKRSRGRGDDADTGDDDAVCIVVARDCATAAVLAAREETELHQAFEQSLALFDPAIAQAQINRLDNALAQVGLLREAERQQLYQAEGQLTRVREERSLFASQVDVLRPRAEKAEADNERLRAERDAARTEVAQLRLDEARLGQQVAELRRLTSDDPFALHAVRVHDGAARAPSHARQQEAQRQLVALEEAEAAARQAVLQELFWDPLCLAFDAGLAWVNACTSDVHARTQANASLATSAKSGVLTAPPVATSADVDLMLLRQQQDELGHLRGHVEQLTHRLRVETLERRRWQELYESEQRRSETQASDFLNQLRHAYDQVQQDREAILEHVQREMAREARQAFSDGRLYEQRQYQRQQQQGLGNGGHGHRRGWSPEDEEEISDESAVLDDGKRAAQHHRTPRRQSDHHDLHHQRSPAYTRRRGVSPYSPSASPAKRQQRKL